MSLHQKSFDKVRYTADRKSIDKMDLESVRRYLEKGGHEDDKKASNIEKMPPRFFERFVMEGLHIDLIEPGRGVCSMKVPPRLLVTTTNLELCALLLSTYSNT